MLFTRLLHQFQTVLFTALCCTLVSNPLNAQLTPPADTAINPVFKGMAWRNIGPTRGGVR
ncbi:hypothetical protein [Spirosoma telluris]|uniref:hypothetical protein n=1 Tax=Spirosoma telluris TaxID=2183553 RepID=UPI002FC39365